MNFFDYFILCYVASVVFYAFYLITQIVKCEEDIQIGDLLCTFVCMLIPILNTLLMMIALIYFLSGLKIMRKVIFKKSKEI